MHALPFQCSVFLITVKSESYLSYLYTVIRFDSISAKFGICTVGGLSGTLLKLKYTLIPLNVRILARDTVPISININVKTSYTRIPHRTNYRLFYCVIRRVRAV
jgi:hypothetical protein